MKKSFLLFIALAFVLPAFAIVDNTEVQKAQIKYQKKLDKIKRKQEIQCIKHPERCTASPMVETKLTLGAAQKSVKIGTSQTDVALALGSPNIVTTDSDGKETWIYDKVASVQSYNTNGFEIGAKLGGGGYGSHGAGGSRICRAGLRRVQACRRRGGGRVDAPDPRGNGKTARRQGIS